MILWIVRLIYAFAIGGAGTTGSPVFAVPALVSGAILFFVDGGWPPLVTYGLIGVVLFIFFASAFT